MKAGPFIFGGKSRWQVFKKFPISVRSSSLVITLILMSEINSPLPLNLEKREKRFQGSYVYG